MARVKLDPVAVRKFGYRNAAIAVKKVQAATLSGAKRMAPRSPGHLSGNRLAARGRRLSDATRATPVKFRGWQVEARVETLVPYAMTVHEGSKSHIIRPRRKRALKFYWVRTVARQYGRRRLRPGQASFFKHVIHPGNRRPVRFLTTPLAVSARANNFLYRRTR